MIHNEPHYLAGKTVAVKFKGTAPRDVPQSFVVEDYWDRITGQSWQKADNNFAVLDYASRAGSQQMPLDDEVLYGKIGPFGYLAHTSEIVDEGTPE